MTSAAKTNNRAAAFTLLEIVVVLAIASIVMGGAVGLMIYSSDERELRRGSTGIELMAKRARTTAVLQQTPYALEFRETEVRLLPLAQAGQIERTTALGREVGGREVEEEDDGTVKDTYLLGDMKVFVRRWNSDQWLSTEKDVMHVWRFDPNGICEPLGVRLQVNESWNEDIYHPLTATIRENFLEAR